MSYFDGTASIPIPSAGSRSTFATILGADKIAIEMPSYGTLLATTTCNVFVEVAHTATTGEFKRVKAMGVYSANSGIYDWEVPSTTGDWIAVCEPAVGFGYMRLHLSTAATDGMLSANAPKVHIIRL